MEDAFLASGSKIKALELLSVIKGIKPAARQGYYDNELFTIYSFCKKNRLFCVKSEFKVIPEEEGYSNKGVIAGRKDEKGMWFLYISKEEYTAYKAAYYEIKGMHYELGRVLGYPECCCNFFKENSQEMAAKSNNYDPLVIKNSEGNTFSLFNNIFKKEEDISLISHFPCSLNCQESSKIGKKRLDMLKEYPEISGHIISELAQEIDFGNKKIKFVLEKLRH